MIVNSLRFKIKYSRYNLYSYIKYLYDKHNVYNKIISSKYNFMESIVTKYE